MSKNQKKGGIERKDIIGYYVGGELVCEECITKEETDTEKDMPKHEGTKNQLKGREASGSTKMEPPEVEESIDKMRHVIPAANIKSFKKEA